MAVFGVLGAGALGAWSRYLLGLALRRHSVEFPWGTLAINVLGCILVALAGSLAAAVPAWGPFIVRDVMIGFIGAFTTFSTFTVETLLLLEQAPLAAGLYVAGSTLAGLLAVGFGWWLAARLGF